MSYCRWGEADVYVIPTNRGFECVACAEPTFDPEVIAAHLEQHIADGHHVPADVIPAIREDARTDRYGYANLEAS